MERALETLAVGRGRGCMSPHVHPPARRGRRTPSKQKHVAHKHLTLSIYLLRYILPLHRPSPATGSAQRGSIPLSKKMHLKSTLSVRVEIYQ